MDWEKEMQDRKIRLMKWGLGLGIMGWLILVGELYMILRALQ